MDMSHEQINDLVIIVMSVIAHYVRHLAYYYISQDNYDVLRTLGNMHSSSTYCSDSQPCSPFEVLQSLAKVCRKSFLVIVFEILEIEHPAVSVQSRCCLVDWSLSLKE